MSERYRENIPQIFSGPSCAAPQVHRWGQAPTLHSDITANSRRKRSADCSERFWLKCSSGNRRHIVYISRFPLRTVKSNDPLIAARDFGANERTEDTGILCVSGSFCSAQSRQKIPAVAARDFGLNEAAGTEDISYIFRGFRCAQLSQKIRCHKMKKLPPM